MNANSLALTALLASLLSSPALAERADRDKPVLLEADRVMVDDKQQLHVYEGNVMLNQGTLSIRTSRLTVRQDSSGYQKGVATGGANGMASFRQKREASIEYVEGEAERIEHDSRADKTEFFGKARVKSGMDEVSGQYIVYDSKTENYVVTSGPGGTTAAAGSGERVRAVIQPKNKSDTGSIPSSPPNSKESKQ